MFSHQVLLFGAHDLVEKVGQGQISMEVAQKLNHVKRVGCDLSNHIILHVGFVMGIIFDKKLYKEIAPKTASTWGEFVGLMQPAYICLHRMHSRMRLYISLFLYANIATL